MHPLAPPAAWEGVDWRIAATRGYALNSGNDWRAGLLSARPLREGRSRGG